jgi:hypothetical protein
VASRGHRLLTDGMVHVTDSYDTGIPSKGRMAEDTMDLLEDCQLKVGELSLFFVKGLQ